ncbi:hypothetical protein HOE67_00180 [Candidatus Peregrinibacteria bacterium]|jgi:hypothetical protein|nr:hypothetical protein [Candidatus Peregrinibacteria bacterium]MBT4055510.1 hypothetical protein [Candidatus Peregrinibacteria bacterium]
MPDLQDKDTEAGKRDGYDLVDALDTAGKRDYTGSLHHRFVPLDTMAGDMRETRAEYMGTDADLVERLIEGKATPAEVDGLVGQHQAALDQIDVTSVMSGKLQLENLEDLGLMYLQKICLNSAGRIRRKNQPELTSGDPGSAGAPIRQAEMAKMAEIKADKSFPATEKKEHLTRLGFKALKTLVEKSTTPPAFLATAVLNGSYDKKLGDICPGEFTELLEVCVKRCNDVAFFDAYCRFRLERGETSQVQKFIRENASSLINLPLHLSRTFRECGDKSDKTRLEWVKQVAKKRRGFTDLVEYYFTYLIQYKGDYKGAKKNPKKTKRKTCSRCKNT